MLDDLRRVRMLQIRTILSFAVVIPLGGDHRPGHRRGQAQDLLGSSTGSEQAGEIRAGGHVDQERK